MLNQQTESMLKAHKILCEFNFRVVELDRGYANRTLRIDLDKNEITEVPVTQQMKDLWVGGKGFDLWMMFQEIDKDTKWDSNNNPLCFAAGPLGGTTSFPGAGKTIVTTISPITQIIIDSNVGGYFGPFLKFAGYDGLTIVGKAKEESLIYIDTVNGKITIETAPMESIDSHVLAEELTEMYANDEMDRRNIAVVSSGQAAEHTYMGVLNFSFWDWRRAVPRLKQAGRGGVGTVFRNKNLKALAIKTPGVTPAWSIEESKVAKEVAPKTFETHACASEVETIDGIIDNWDANPEQAIEIMQDIQERYRFISKTAIDQVNARTGVAKSQLYHVATFYSAFSLEEKGETIIQVCMGTACHVKGATNILESFERELGLETGATTEDKKFTLEAVACLGACSIAPVVKVGEEVLGDVQACDVIKILKQAKRGVTHA